MDCTIREILTDEYPLLDEFLYQAIFIPEGVQPPPRDIIKQPELQVYVQNFGQQKGDSCLVAQCDGRVVGAVWVRITTTYVPRLLGGGQLSFSVVGINPPPKP